MEGGLSNKSVTEKWLWCIQADKIMRFVSSILPLSGWFAILRPSIWVLIKPWPAVSTGRRRLAKYPLYAKKTHLHFGPLNDNDRQLLLCLYCICKATLAANHPTTHSSYSLSGIECLYLLLSPPLTPLKVKYSHSESTNVFSKHQHRDTDFYWGYGERTHCQHTHTHTQSLTNVNAVMEIVFGK